MIWTVILLLSSNMISLKKNKKTYYFDFNKMTVAIFFSKRGRVLYRRLHLARNFRSGNKHVRMRVDELGLFLITASCYSNVSSVSLVISFVILFPIYLFIIYYENRNSYDAISGDEEIEHTQKTKKCL